MDFHDFPTFLGKSGMDLMHPPKLCASLFQTAKMYMLYRENAVSSFSLLPDTVSDGETVIGLPFWVGLHTTWGGA